MRNTNTSSAVANNTIDPKTIDAKIVKTKSVFADRRKKLTSLRDAKKVSQAQYEEFLSVLKNKETRALYQIVRNAKSDVRAKRTEYNRKRYEDQKTASAKLKALLG